MTLADLLPVRIGLFDRTVPRTRHRRPDEIERLKFLLYGANLCIRGMRVQLDDKDREHANTVARIDERHAEVVDGMERQIAELERRLAIGVMAKAAADETQEIDQEQVRRYCVQPMPLHQAAAAGRLGPGTDPGHITA